MCFQVEQTSRPPVYPCNVLNIFCYDGLNAMKWYYEWRLNKVRAKISALEAETNVYLADDYTAHSRLRVLTRLADGLQHRLVKKYASQPAAAASKEGC
jgi:hypothetical protein